MKQWFYTRLKQSRTIWNGQSLFKRRTPILHSLKYIYLFVNAELNENRIKSHVDMSKQPALVKKDFFETTNKTRTSYNDVSFHSFDSFYSLIANSDKITQPCSSIEINNLNYLPYDYRFIIIYNYNSKKCIRNI